VTHLRLLRHRELSQGVPPAATVQEDDQSTGTAAALVVEARRCALNLLAYREHSLSELITRLEAKGFPRPLSGQVAQQLAEEGLQSDARFVEVFARSRVEKGSGPLLLRAELRARGVDEGLIEQYVTQTAEFWIARASRLAQKRFKTAPDSRERWAEQARYLSRKGYSIDLIYAALGNQRD
jgi:regulatory protein